MGKDNQRQILALSLLAQLPISGYYFSYKPSATRNNPQQTKNNTNLVKAYKSVIQLFSNTNRG
jgi:hypothetical protein